MSGSTAMSCDPQTAGSTASYVQHASTEELAELELARLRWPSGPVCPFCGNAETYALNLRTVNRRRYKCGHCRRQFSVTKGTILEGSKLSLQSWIRLIQMLCERAGDLSINQVSRELHVSHRAAQNAFDRLSYAAKREPLSLVLKKREEG